MRKQCLAELEDSRGDAYWEYAALGEASLICGDWPGAEEWYGRAAQQGKRRFGDLQSSRRNARLILQYWDRSLPDIERHLYVPPVMVFAGHMIDRPGRETPRFPSEAESFVVLLSFEIDSFQRGTIILNSPDLRIDYLVLAPRTGKKQMTGKVYFQAIGGGRMRKSDWPSGTPIKITPEAAGIEAADYVHDWLRLDEMRKRQPPQ